MKHYTVELRIREAGDVGDVLPVKVVVELPYPPGSDGLERTRVLWRWHDTVGGSVEWAVGKANEWMRNRESKG